ncbi:MAG: PAS domain-containing sensor histidine kinase [Armatimonadota bacterium]|nr:PAS domain-containing sensor histidine kinase [Armatimonadota bacterium]
MGSQKARREPSRQELLTEVQRLRARALKAEAALERVHGEGDDLPWCDGAVDEQHRYDCPYREFIDNLAAIVAFIDAGGALRYVNAHGCNFFGYDPEEVLGRDSRSLIPDVSSSGRDQSRVVDELLSAPEEHRDEEYEMRRADGSPVWVSWARRPVRDSDGKLLGIVSIGRDVTRRKQAEQKLVAYQQRLRALASELALSEERERRRIAGRIHDEIQQNLAYAKLCASALRQRRDVEESSKAVLDEVHSLLDAAIAGTRALSFELSPPMLYELGLSAAVEWLVDRAGEGCKTEFEFHDDGAAEQLDDNVRVLLFQAVRELLANVVQHAGAAHATVSITRPDGEVRISVVDDGAGFEPEEELARPGAQDGMGLFNIRERLALLGGSMEVISSPGQGTRVVLEAPAATQ